MRRDGVSSIADRLASIQRTIAGGAPLQEVFDAITSDAWDLLGHDNIIGLRLVDPDDHDFVQVVSSCGLDEQLLEKIRRGPTREGAGGQAIRENRLVVLDGYSRNPDAIPALAQRGLQSAMAAPVREYGEAIGSLTIASFDGSHTYSVEEQLSLMTLAEHASLAIAAAKATERLREAERDRQLFLAMVTHKLKTPLMVVTGAVDLLDRAADRLDDAKRAELLAQAQRSTAEIGKMIDNLLKGSRAEYRNELTTLSIDELIKVSVDGFTNVRPVELSGLTEVSIETNAEAFKHALGTVVENAVKHSPPDTPIEIKVATSPQEVTVTVTNQGALPLGTEPSHLFQPMVQGSPAGPGVGLGLYIARRLMSSMRGSIGARSNGGKVSFDLSVPVKIREEQGSATP